MDEPYKSKAEIEGLKRLRLKKANKIPGNIVFHVSDRGVVEKVEDKDIIK